MGLLDIFMPYKPATTGYGPNRPAQNGFTNWANNNPYALQGLGAGLSSIGAGMVGHGSDTAGMLTGVNQALAAQQGPIGQMALMQRQYNQQQQDVAKQQQQQTATIKWLQDKGQADLAAAVQNGMMSGSDAVKMALTPQTADAASDPASVSEYKFYANQEMQAGRQPQSYADWRVGSNQTIKSGLGQPIALKNRKTGEYQPFQPMSDGSMINTLTGERANGTDWLFDPGTAAFNVARGQTLGKSVAESQFSIPAGQLAVTQTKEAIDKLRNDKQGLDETFGSIMGVPQQMTPAWPGTPKANFINNANAAMAKAFFQGREMLRGGGPITDFEGKKAEDAVTTMGLALENGDKKAFLEALDQFQKAVEDGYAKLSQQASMTPGFSGAIAPQSGNQVLTYNPVTGELE